MSQPRFCHRLSAVQPPPWPSSAEPSRIVTPQPPQANAPKAGPTPAQFHAVPCQGPLCSLWMAGADGAGACADVVQAASLNALASGMSQFIAAVNKARGERPSPDLAAAPS